jgi:uncharacterized protein (TIRG00374 family)
MLAQKPEFKKWVTLLAALSFVVFIIYFIFFTDLGQVAAVIEGVNIPIYLIAFAAVIGGAVFNTLTWKACLDSVSVKTTFRRVFNLGWVGAFLDCIIPGGWSGDVFMTYLLSKDKGVDGAKVFASIIIKDVLELAVVLGSLLVGITLLVLNYSVNSALLIAIGIVLVFLALPLILIIYLSTNVSATKRLLQGVVRLVARFRDKPLNSADLESKITDFHDGIMSMKNRPRAMVKPIILQTITWLFDIIVLYVVFVALGSMVGVDKVVITNTVVDTIRGQGVALAGFSQIISSQLYQVLGINISLAQASSLLAGFANFWFRLMISFVFFQLYGLGTIAEKLLNRAFKEKTKKDKKDFEKQTDRNERDFEEKAGSERKDFEKLSDNKERNFKEHKDSSKRDFEEKKENDKSDRIAQRDTHRRDFEEKTDVDRKNFEILRDSNEREYTKQRDSNRRDFEEKTDSERKDFEKLRDNNDRDYLEKRDSNRIDFEKKTDSDKTDRVIQRDIHRKDFKEKTDSDKKDFEKLSDDNESDHNEQKESDKKDFEEKTDSDKSDYKDQKECDKKDFEEKVDKDKKDFQNRKDLKEKVDKDKKVLEDGKAPQKSGS